MYNCYFCAFFQIANIFSFSFVVADDVANEHPYPMMIKCKDNASFQVDTLAGISKFGWKELDDFKNMDTLRANFVKGWIVSIRDTEHFGKRIIVIDDGTRQVECYLRLDKERYPLIHNPVEVGRLILLYKVCVQFEVTFGRDRVDYDNFTIHGGYSNILAIF